MNRVGNTEGCTEHSAQMNYPGGRLFLTSANVLTVSVVYPPPPKKNLISIRCSAGTEREADEAVLEWEGEGGGVGPEGLGV